jgi:hypothetical protein
MRKKHTKNKIHIISINYFINFKEKNMKKLLLFSILSLAVLFQNSVNAQFGGGLQLGIFNPLGEGSGDASFGLNVPVRMEVTDEINVGVNLGYYFSRSQVLGITTTGYTAPLLATFEYGFGSNDFTPYASFDAGIYILGFNSDFISGSSSQFGLAPGAGGRYEINRELFFDINLKYHLIFTEGTNNSSALGANLGIIYYF